MYLHILVNQCLCSSIDHVNDWLSFTAILPVTPSLPRSCHQFHMHLLLHCPAHRADQEVCPYRIWESSLPPAYHLLCGANNSHHLLYPFINLTDKWIVLLCKCVWVVDDWISTFQQLTWAVTSEFELSSCFTTVQPILWHVWIRVCCCVYKVGLATWAYVTEVDMNNWLWFS